MSESVAEDITRLKTAWVNERLSPELQMYERLLVEDLTMLLENQEQRIEEMKTQNSSLLELNLYQMEVDRVKFLIKSYLRTRLVKIQMNSFYYEKNKEELGSRLSDAEKEFVIDLNATLINHFDNMLVNDLPEKAQGYGDDIATPPKLGTHVVIKVLQDIGEFDIGDGTTMELNQGDQLIVKYSSIADLLNQELVRLI
eukprot:TRINITY_DN1662_c0_g1_i3.p1 TRINITY_DN1662_c0_g1~~TRINITY_DN1662_c0_g1_i3.p1  ORF type:complete len:198 (-),score=77.38 TRINITY_DN1662_c0_g1_i3:23-616(-)